MPSSLAIEIKGEGLVNVKYNMTVEATETQMPSMKTKLQWHRTCMYPGVRRRNMLHPHYGVYQLVYSTFSNRSVPIFPLYIDGRSRKQLTRTALTFGARTPGIANSCLVNLLSLKQKLLVLFTVVSVSYHHENKLA